MQATFNCNIGLIAVVSVFESLRASLGHLVIEETAMQQWWWKFLLQLLTFYNDDPFNLIIILSSIIIWFWCYRYLNFSIVTCDVIMVDKIYHLSLYFIIRDLLYWVTGNGLIWVFLSTSIDHSYTPWGLCRIFQFL